MTKFDQFLLDRQAEGGDPERDPYEGIISQVLSADTPDAVLTPIEALQGRDVLGIPLILVGFELNQSEFDAGSPFYASMAVVRSDNQEPTVVNCGHKKVLAQLVKLDEFNNDADNPASYPYQVMFRTRGTSKHGTPMLELTKWPEVDGGSPPF